MMALERKAFFRPSSAPYDWLGSGVYFWESDPQRAYEWALEQQSRKGKSFTPFVVGAVIDLGNCLDLTVRENVDLVKDAYRSIVQQAKNAKGKMPVNQSLPGDKTGDKVLRYLDCAVMKRLHSIIELKRKSDPTVSPFDTVRAVFGEGVPIYEGSGFREKTHVQIAVRNPDCIKGIFLPPPPPK